MSRSHKSSALCLCQSQRTYGTCCLPLHRGEVPASAEQLMRSRFTAFAMGLVEYLVATLHPNHPEAALPPLALEKSLRAACATYRYLGLTILEAQDLSDHSFVTFRARVFQKGKDVSFSERSRFERVDGAFRYLSGEPAESVAEGVGSD